MMRLSGLCFAIVALVLTAATSAPVTSPDVTADEVQRIALASLQPNDSSNKTYVLDKAGRSMEDAAKETAIVGQIIQDVGDNMMDLGRWMQVKTRSQELEHPFHMGQTYGLWGKIRRGVEKAAKNVGKIIEKAGKDVGKAVEKAAKDVGKNVEKAAKDAGKVVEKAAKDAGKAAEKAAKEAGKAVEKAAKEVARVAAVIVAERVANKTIGAISDRVDKFEGFEPRPTTKTLIRYARSLQDLGERLQNAGQNMGSLTAETMFELKALPFVNVTANAILSHIAAEF